LASGFRRSNAAVGRCWKAPGKWFGLWEWLRLENVLRELAPRKLC
jgi:hypothetical protein